MRVLRSRGDRAGARFRLRSGASALRAAAGRSIGARARRSAAGRCRRGGRPARAPGRTPGQSAPSSGVDPSFAILHGLYWLCANLAAAGPLCLVVDDAHWADAPSLRYLAFLLTRLEELDAALVVATRPREAGTDAELLATLTTDPSADVIRLPPLTRAAVAQLVEARLGGVPDPVVVDACLRVTRGTPFLVRELVEALSEGGIAPTAEARARRANRCTNGRSLGSPPAPSAARACRAARPSARGSRAERPAPSGATRGPRRGRGSRCSRAADDRGDPRARPTADVHAPARPQRDLLGALQRRARTRPPPCRRSCSPSSRAPASASPSTCWSASPPPIRWVVERLVEAARAAAKAGRSRVGGGLPAPSAR